MRRNSGFNISRKSDFEIVTSADLAVDEHIKRRIAVTYGDHGVLSEEAVVVDKPTATYRWIIDPLDGTANFAHGQDHVAVSMALSCNDVVVLGVVHAPFHEQTFWAEKGRGAFRDGEPIRTTEIKDLGLALIGTGFPHDRSNISKLVDRLGVMLQECGDIRRLAAPALDICWVADGRLDGFLDRVRIWDVAAAGLIATEAGACRLDLDADWDMQRVDGEDVLLAAPGIFEAIRRIVTQNSH